MAKKTFGKPQETGNSTAALSAENRNGSAGSEQRETGGASREMTLSNEEIAERAYQIYEREGRSDGRAMDHWLQAESELRSERQTHSTNPEKRQEMPRSARQYQQSPGV